MTQDADTAAVEDGDMCGRLVAPSNMTHARKLQLLRNLAEESRAANERTKATLAWFRAWMEGRTDA